MWSIRKMIKRLDDFLFFYEDGNLIDLATFYAIRRYLVKQEKYDKKNEKKSIYCISLTPSSKMTLEHYAMQRGFTGTSALIEFWAHQLQTEEKICQEDPAPKEDSIEKSSRTQ